MLYPISQILRDVKIALHKNPNPTPRLVPPIPDQLTLDDIISTRIVAAVRQAHLQAPLHWLEGGLPIDDAIYWLDDHSGWLLLPQDFLRLMLMQMDDWRVAVTCAQPIEEADLARLESRWKGVGANPERPACLLVRRAEGLALQFYGCLSQQAQVLSAVYLPEPCIEQGHIRISQACYNTVIQNIISQQ